MPPAIILLDISDIAHPKQIGRLTMSPPFILAGQQGVHDVLKIPGKPLLFSHSETSSENCDTDPLDHVAARVEVVAKDSVGEFTEAVDFVPDVRDEFANWIRTSSGWA